MAWGALVKTAAKGAIKKKAKKKGAEMAKNITNKKEKDNSSSIVVREKSTSLVGPLLGGDTDSADSSANTPKKSRSRSPLDRINSSLKDIMKTLKKRRKLMLNKSRRMRVQADKEKKGKREGLLEKKKTGNKMLKSVAAGAKGWWERLQKFLLMTMLGALVKSIMDNWKSIKAQIDKVVKFVQDLWKFMEPVITPLIEGLKWVVKQWSEMGSELMGLSKDKPKVEKETDKLSEDLKALEKTKKDVDGKFKEAEQGVRDLDKKTFDEVANEAGLSSEVSPDNEEQPGKTKDQVQGIETLLADAEKRLEKFEKEGDQSKIEGVTKKIEFYEKRLSKMKKYEKGAVPVPETGPAVVHKGEVIIPAPVVKMAGGPMNIVNLIEMGRLPGLGGGGGGTDAITAKATTKSLGKRGKDIGNLLALPFRDRTAEADPRSKFASLSEHLPPVMMEKMEKTLTAIKEQTEYEDPAASTIIIRVPESAPQSGGGGGGSKTIAVPVGATPKDTLNRYVNAVIQKALF